MPCTQAIFDEIGVLARYNLATTQEGIKVHKDADPVVIAAVQRLYHKGLVTQSDGGYLTALGHEAAEHVQSALRLLTPDG